MEKLGINWIQFGAQLVNVGILVVVLKKFLFKPILKILESRRDLVEKQQEKEAELEKRLADLGKKEQEIIKKAKVSADDLLKDAQKEARKLKVEVLKKAEEQAKRQQRELLLETEQSVSHKKDELQAMIRKESVVLANNAMKELLPEDAHVKITEAQIAKFLKHE